MWQSEKEYTSETMSLSTIPISSKTLVWYLSLPIKVRTIRPSGFNSFVRNLRNFVKSLSNWSKYALCTVGGQQDFATQTPLLFNIGIPDSLIMALGTC